MIINTAAIPLENESFIKMYVVKGSILPEEESGTKKDKRKESRTIKKDLMALLTTGKKG